MCVLSEHCLESLFSRSDGDGEGALRFLCLYSGQDELCKYQFLQLTTSHKSQSRHVKHLKAGWKMKKNIMFLSGCNSQLFLDSNTPE